MRMPRERDLRMLSGKQRKQVQRQLQLHQHERYTVDIPLNETVSEVLNDFVVWPHVMRPECMTSLILAQYLWLNRPHNRKLVCDMGCGSGIQGITMALSGATYVSCYDIDRSAVANTCENIGSFNVQENCEVLQSDLFAHSYGKFDLIVFNHPFFPSAPIPQIPVSAAMLDPGTVLDYFLLIARYYLRRGGKILMPFFHLAGLRNNPSRGGNEYRYLVTELARHEITSGLQQGTVSIYELLPQESLFQQRPDKKQGAIKRCLRHLRLFRKEQR